MPSTAGRVKLVAVLLFALAMGAGAVGHGCYRLYQIAQIRRGPAAEGRATDWAVEPRRDRVYRVRYTFEADGAPRAGGPTVVPKDVHDATRKAPALTVRYAADRPDWHLPEAAIAGETERAALTALPGAVVCAFVLLGSLFAWLGARLRARAEPPVNIPKDPPTLST